MHSWLKGYDCTSQNLTSSSNKSPGLNILQHFVIRYYKLKYKNLVIVLSIWLGMVCFTALNRDNICIPFLSVLVQDAWGVVENKGRILNSVVQSLWR